MAVAGWAAQASREAADAQLPRARLEEDRIAVGDRRIVQQSLIKKRQFRRGHDTAAAGHPGFAHDRIVEAHDGVLGDLGFGRRREWAGVTLGVS